MLEVRCEEYLAEVRESADSMGLRPKLEEQLEYLATFACKLEGGRIEPERTKCELMQDHAPLSFFFRMLRQQPDGSYSFWFCGGLIFHGAGTSGSEFPTLSTRIGDCSKAEWSVHT